MMDTMNLHELIAKWVTDWSFADCERLRKAPSFEELIETVQDVAEMAGLSESKKNSLAEDIIRHLDINWAEVAVRVLFLLKNVQPQE